MISARGGVSPTGQIQLTVLSPENTLGSCHRAEGRHPRLSLAGCVGRVGKQKHREIKNSKEKLEPVYLGETLQHRGKYLLVSQAEPGRHSTGQQHRTLTQK
jgi:hypothetical protein